MMPEGVELLYSSDMSRFVRTRLSVLGTNALIGLGLVIVMLFIFLNFRTAFWVAMGIPLTMLGVFYISPYFGVHIDVITLMGMIMVIGLIVDDAIVIGENIYRRRELGDSPLDAAVNGTSMVIRPVFATIITSILAFSPMFFMSGMMGKFIYSIPLIIILSLLISFAEVIIILPAHLTSGKTQGIDHDESELLLENDPRAGTWFDPIRNLFQRFMVSILRLRYIIIILFLLALGTTIWYAASKMQFILFPNQSTDQFYVAIETPTGSSLQATSDKLKAIEDLILALPKTELDSFWTRVGSQFIGGLPFAPGECENWAVISVTLTPFSERHRSAHSIVDELKKKTDALKGFDVVRYVVEGGGPAIGMPITLHVVGSEDEKRKKLAAAVVDYLATMKDVQDIDRDDKRGKQQVSITINYTRLSQLGLTVADVAQNVRLAYDGEVVTRVRYGEEDVGFRVILEKKTRQRADYLGKLKIPNQQGRLIPLKEVARFETDAGPLSFLHYDGERTITVTADLMDGASLTPLEATTTVLNHFNLSKDWPGMQLIVGGEAEETQDSMISLAMAMAMTAVGIYLILVLLFNNLTQPVLVMFAIPFGLIGIVSAFALHGEPLGFLAMLGVIGMMGVVVNDSLILVNYINFHREEDPEKKFIRIIAEATATRLRPILLTSITTVAGLLPTAYGIGGSDPFVAPMALALGYGILFATPLILLLLPCLYMIHHDAYKILRRLPGFKNFM